MSASKYQRRSYTGPPTREIDDLSPFKCLRCGKTLLHYDPERVHNGHHVIKCHKCKALNELLDGTTTVHAED